MGFGSFVKGIFQRRPPSPMEFQGTEGVISFAGWLQQTEKDVDLNNPIAKFTAFGNAINDSTVIASATRYMVGLIAGARWTADVRKDAGAAGVKAMKIVEDGIFGAKTSQPWETTCGQAAMSPLYGFSTHEWIQRRRKDGMVVMGDVQSLPQWTIQRWDKGDDGLAPLQGIEQWVPGMPTATPRYINRAQLLYVVDKKITTRPDGLGLLRHVFKKYKTLERYEVLEGFGFEGDLRGIPYGRAPYAAIKKYAIDNAKDENWVKNQTSIISKFIASHIKTPGLGIILDSENYPMTDGSPSAVPKWALDIMKGDGAGLDEIAKTIERITREIARVLGVEFLLLGGDGKGSLALSKDKTSMFAALLAATLSQIAWSITYDVAWPLIAANGLDPEQCCPTILPDPITQDDILMVTQALYQMAQAGAPLMPGDPAIDQVRQRLHLAEQPKVSPDLAGALARPPLVGPDGKPLPPNSAPPAGNGKPAPNAPNGKPPIKPEPQILNQPPPAREAA